MSEGCQWAEKSPILQEYHDLEWGHPIVDSLELFEKLCLQCISAGSFKSTDNSKDPNEPDFDSAQLSVIEARGLYREKFYFFDPSEMINITPKDIDALVEEEKDREKNSESDNSFKGLCKNKQKLKALITNAKAYLKMQDDGVDFAEFCWSFTGNKMILGLPNDNEIPSYANEMSAELKKKGFSYTTPAVCYAFMQAVGMINAHAVTCSCRNDCIDEAKIFGK